MSKPEKTIRLVCIVEVVAATIEAAAVRLDAFREAVQPSHEYGITIYRATEADADAAVYATTTVDEEA